MAGEIRPGQISPDMATDAELAAAVAAALADYQTAAEASAAYVEKAAATTATVLANESTTSTSFVDLATVGPSVTVTVGASGRVLLMWMFDSYVSSAPAITTAGVAISGATTVAPDFPLASDKARTTTSESGVITAVGIRSGLNPGSTTFKLQYKAGAGTCNFLRRTLIVIPL